ncbi:MAG: hypothetical protein K5989_04055 [Lachnospiraceae bacterium]|nr:hypothetical protein [Lachnospiraceae bacterium]
MSRLKGILKKLTGNLGLKILSLLLAFLLWVGVVSIDNPVMTLPFASVPITVENADLMEKEGKAFELSDSSKTVTVSVRAERSVLSDLSRDNFKASIDMAKLSGNQVPIEVKATRYADRIQSVYPRQEYATVFVEDLEKIYCKIHAETVGDPAEGYIVGKSTIRDNVVQVKGPASIVSRIENAVARINVSGMSGEIHSTENIILLDENGESVDTSTLTLSITQTYVSAEIWAIKEVPLHYGVSGVPAQGFGATGQTEISPASISITAPDSILKNISAISIPSDLVSLEGVTDSVSKTVNLTSYLPDGVSLVYPETESEAVITVYVEPHSSRELAIPLQNIAAGNVPEGMVATVQDTQEPVTIEVRGLSKDIEAIDPVGITGIADLSVIQAGENGTIIPNVYEVPVTLDLPEGVEQTGTGTVHILLQVAVPGMDEGNVDMTGGTFNSASPDNEGDSANREDDTEVAEGESSSEEEKAGEDKSSDGEKSSVRNPDVGDESMGQKPDNEGLAGDSASGNRKPEEEDSEDNNDSTSNNIVNAKSSTRKSAGFGAITNN